MKKLLIYLLFVLGLALPQNSFATIARVTGGCQSLGANGGTSSNIDFSTSTFIVVSLAWDSSQTQPVFSSTSVPSGNWTAKTAQALAPAKNVLLYPDTSHRSYSSTEQITATRTSGFVSICYLGFTGVKSSAEPFDVENGAAGGGGVNNVSTGSITPSEDNEVIVSGFAGTDGVNHAAVSLITKEADILLSAGNNYACAIAYQIQTTATARNPNWSWVDASKVAGVTIASFKSAPAAAGSSTKGLGLGIIGQ